MKNLFLCFLMGFVLLTIVNAQNLKLYDTTGADVTNDTIFFQANDLNITYTIHAWVENISSAGIFVKVKKREISIINGSSNTFCWAGTCYPPFVYESTDNVYIASNQTDTNNFIADYSPQGNPGASIIAYTFFDENNTADSAFVVIVFDINTAINNLVLQTQNIIKLYPNPVKSYGFIIYSLQNSNNCVELYNILGKKVSTIILPYREGKKRVDFSYLRAGLYFLRLRENKNFVGRLQKLK